MQTTSLADFKAHLSDYVGRAEREHERYTVTRNGRPAVVILSAEELESIEETIFWLSQPGIHEELAKAEAEILSGETVTSKDELLQRLGLA